MTQCTGFADKANRPLHVGDFVHIPLGSGGNAELHGEWAIYEIVKGPGGFLFSYVCSQTGMVMPVGMTRAYMHDMLWGADETDLKTLCFQEGVRSAQNWLYQSRDQVLGHLGTLAKNRATALSSLQDANSTNYSALVGDIDGCQLDIEAMDDKAAQTHMAKTLSDLRHKLVTLSHGDDMPENIVHD